MPDLLTPQALATAGPLVLETFFKHFFGPKLDEKGKAREDLMYDEAFVLMKTFLEIATKYPVAALQRFGQVRTPTPPWVAVHRVSIPSKSLVESAEYLIKAFGGEEMAYRIAGGTKWWQVRAGPGVEGEWIVMKKDWKDVVKEEKKAKVTIAEDGPQGEEEGEFRPEMDRLRCMLYIHGGAYYWGSINTHRYVIWRLAKKMHGRCFAVNYRKAPQYPFPCAIQDCLAAYRYLTHPPPGAVHRPVDPKSIIIAGDSAGGGLVLALLQILRDTDGLEMPAGAILISPWSDLTHSFPSILENTKTDIVPPYGFIHKPSSLWPPPPPMLTDQIQSRLRARVKEAVSRLHNDPSSANQAHRRLSFLSHEADAPIVQPAHQVPSNVQTQSGAEIKTSKPKKHFRNSDEKDDSDLHPFTNKAENAHPGPHGEPHNPSKANPASLYEQLKENQGNPTLSQCVTPLYLDVKEEQVAIDTQIQMYATNAQLCHPWVSPVLGYLGGLPPLFIMCGANEVLRDEIIYLAHKAADPEKYPLREDVRAMLPSLEGIEGKHGPTNVHFQIYDGACHDLPLFSMTKHARGVFRAMASFARYVTPSAPGSLYMGRSQPASTRQSGSSRQTQSQPTTPKINQDGTILRNDLTATPPTMTPRSSIPVLSPVITTSRQSIPAPAPAPMSNITSPLSSPSLSPSQTSLSLPPIFRRTDSAISTMTSASSASESELPRSDTASGSEKRKSILPPASVEMPDRLESMTSGDDAGPRFAEHPVDDSRAKEGEAGWPGIYRTESPFTNHMIRERIDTIGVIRPLEPIEELSAMQMSSDEIGMIKEGPAMRYINGQALWDKKYHRAVKGIKKRREKNLKRAKSDAGKLREKWVKVVEGAKAEEAVINSKKGRLARRASDGEEIKNTDDDTDDQRDVVSNDNERKDTKTKNKRDSSGILEQSWSWTWALHGELPPPSAIISRRDTSEARQLALMADRIDSSNQTRTPLHGLSIWVGLASFFSNTSERKAGQLVQRSKGLHVDDDESGMEEHTDKAVPKEGEGDTSTGTSTSTRGEEKSSRKGKGLSRLLDLSLSLGRK